MAARTRKGSIREGSGFVYFVQAGIDGPIKIGWAIDPLDRVRELQVGNHEQLQLLMTVADNGTLEMTLHERFRDLHIRGEWFRPEGDLADVLWLSGLVPHPETAREIEERQAIEAMHRRPVPDLAEWTQPQ